ncbi:ornithine carbamoyltransferase [Taklimakanibacter albus]|uniref:Ornithine carbamoyltransferase n=1 Tax=Taklimakanibacter albus TaxID=2800327 RepID=A0ACC5RDW7_9HYPH|nr:ornithine carbamoyltransferase [Aestuariivirga sp. YIM B02566]MBK1870832.1 ornithine carbamoyltransferase [Aestuariivirga sp. YIM B02566]
MAGDIRHFLDISDFSAAELRAILDRSQAMKSARKGWPKGAVEQGAPLKGRVLAMIFQQPSTRTRVSFEVAMRQLGGEVLVISANDMQLGRGETIADTARVLSRYVDGIMIRAKQHDHLLELAEHASIPVINGLTNKSHPCQVMADIMTFEEHRGSIDRHAVAWVGDGNNVATSWIHAMTKLGGELRLGCPTELAPDPDAVAWARREGGKVKVTTSAEEAVKDVSCVLADVWVSMHDTDAAARHNMLKPYQVNDALMRQARPDALFMHCLPAHRGEEVTAQVMDGPQSVVFDEAENRLHIQKSILLRCLGTE